MAISGLLLTGCAGTPSNYSSNPELSSAPLPGDFDRLPQTTLPGATRDEVKLLAMGAARNKGWSITKTGSDRLIAQRNADPSLLDSYGTGPLPGSTLEVTSFFVQQGSNLNVATKAEVVSPAISGQPVRRTDVTETYRDTLEQSLNSLRTTWSSNRGRVARATPPAQGWADPWAGTPYARPPKTEEPTDDAPAPEVASTPAPAAEPAAATPDVAEPLPEYRPEPERRAAEPAFQTQQTTPMTTPTPEVAETQISPQVQPSYTRPLPEPRRPPPSAAPVIDATAALDTRYRSDYGSPIGNDYGAPTSVAPRENMMALPQSSTGSAGVTSAAYAEQYARQRGCQVSASGSQLIESRQDGEVHKVPCEGSDSFLIKCQNGSCQGLL